MVNKNILQKYAELIVRTGANVQPGQPVNILVRVDQHEFGMMVMEECYKAGAKKVSIDWDCDRQTYLNYKYAEADVLSEVPVWQVEKAKQKVSDLPVAIYIESEDPDALAGIDPEKLSSVSRKRSKILKPFRNEMDGKYQWVIVAVPSAAWSRKCFPELSVTEAVDKMWEAVLECVKITEDNDPVRVWKEHTDFIEKRAKWLTEKSFRSLRYHSENGTDFTVELIPGSKWCGAGTTNPVNGAYYVPNMPTEEIFTSPFAGKCEGTLVSTKPLSWHGQLAENFSVRFENGRAVSVTAEKGQDLLEKMIHMDSTSDMVGEIALVPKESPVNKCGFLFNNTLFDENAVCHIALGRGFKEVLPDGDNLSVEEAQKLGVNDSIIHVDFMVGSDDLSIWGITENGEEIQIFKNGTWVK